MKYALASSVLILILGTASFGYARQEKEHEEHTQQARPAQHETQPAKQQRQDSPEANKQAQHATPAPQQHAQQTPHAQPQRSQRASSTQQPQTHAVNRGPANNSPRPEATSHQTRAQNENRGKSQHGRISDAHYASSFGSGHSFHVNRGDYANRRFTYGGYSFGFIDPWPTAWGYSDDVYVVYADGGYYMYDRVHPGLRISVNIL